MNNTEFEKLDLKVKRILADGTVKNTIIETTGDIQTDMINNYYNQSLYRSLSNDTRKEMKNEIEEFVNDFSNPREYSENLKKAYSILNNEINKLLNMRIIEKSWFSDWCDDMSLDQNSKIAEKISSMVWDSDYYNKVSDADDIMELVEIVRSEKVSVL